MNSWDDLQLSLDPLTGDRHAYAASNPIGYVDTDGHVPSSCMGSCRPQEDVLTTTWIERAAGQPIGSTRTGGGLPNACYYCFLKQPVTVQMHSTAVAQEQTAQLEAQWAVEDAKRDLRTAERKEQKARDRADTMTGLTMAAIASCEVGCEGLLATPYTVTARIRAGFAARGAAKLAAGAGKDLAAAEARVAAAGGSAGAEGAEAGWDLAVMQRAMAQAKEVRRGTSLEGVKGAGKFESPQAADPRLPETAVRAHLWKNSPLRIIVGTGDDDAVWLARHNMETEQYDILGLVQ
jgi:hypothetical protein